MENIELALKAGFEKSNSLISASKGFLKSFSEYTSLPVNEPGFITESQALVIASGLVDTLFKKLSVTEAKSFEELQVGLEKIFTYEEVLLGSRDITESTLLAIKESLHKVYTEKKPLRFTILGFPHKMPNPLYTTASEPDMGEIIAITKIAKLMDCISELYPYGASVVILAENTVFAPISDVTIEEHTHYLRKIQHYESLIDKSERLEIRDIADFHNEEFNDSWNSIEKEFSERYQGGDKEVIKMVESVMPTNFKTINYRNIRDEILLKFFDPHYREPAIDALRSSKYKRALKESFRYLAYHQARYRADFMNKTFPDTFKLTVSPKVGSFGINMLNSECSILPYYGYIILRKNSSFSIQYRIDIPSEARALYLNNGNCQSPFCYQID
jgi:pyoverdine/dityrosine biosynthesis protein Dit1